VVAKEIRRRAGRYERLHLSAGYGKRWSYCGPPVSQGSQPQVFLTDQHFNTRMNGNITKKLIKQAIDLF